MSPLRVFCPALCGALLLVALVQLTACAVQPPADGLPAGEPEPSAARGALQTPYRVLILGDSISIGYTPFVREQLAGIAEVVRPARVRAQGKGPRPENCEGTNKGVGSIDRWLALEGGPFDVIHFNFGLHDMKRVNAETGRNSNDPKDPHQASPARYEAQLREITRELKASGARLVFATTTPVPEGDLRPYREPADAVEYNQIALEVMRAEGIQVNDLFRFISEADPALQRPADVHFTREGSRALGSAAATAILDAAGADSPGPR